MYNDLTMVNTLYLDSISVELSDKHYSVGKESTGETG